MRLEIVFEDNSKKVVEIFDQKFVIGRGKEADIKIVSQEISRKHIVIEQDHGSVFVTDLDSANGVYINNERIESGVRHPFTTYFPVVLGHAISISRLPDEDLGLSTTNFKTAEAVTSTVDKKSDTSKKSLKVNRKTNNGSKNTSILIIILVVLGVILYSFYPEQIRSLFIFQ